MAVVDPARPAADVIMAKFTEEIRLFWTIQIAIAAVFGYLGSNLKLELADPLSQYRNLLFCLMSYFFVLVGSMYNIIGNYYIFEARTRMPDCPGSPDVLIAPTIALLYLMASGIIGSIGAVVIGKLLNGLPLSVLILPDGMLLLAVVGFVFGSVADFLVSRSTYRNVCPCESHMDNAYRLHSGKLGSLYLVMPLRD